ATDDSRFPAAADEPRWDQALRESVAAELAELGGKADLAAARDFFRNRISNDALRVLAGLAELAPAFSQVTIQPLDPDDGANADRPGPDTPPGYAPRASLRAYVDTLDGRSSNRWFYRSAYVDNAHNVSGLSLSSPPVYLHDVVPPRTPVVTRVL